MTTQATLGERLDAQARYLAARVAVTFPWAGPLRVAAGRAVAMTALLGRFDRVEVPPEGPFPGWPAVGRGEPAPPLLRPAPEAPPEPVVPAGAAGAVHPGARPLPAAVRSRLRDVAGVAADVVRVHDDAASDALARAHRADAVTVGTDVHFRGGRFRPDEKKGFAVLAHEAAHVQALLRPGADWRRATGAGRREEEGEALAVEHALTAGPAAVGPAPAGVLPFRRARPAPRPDRPVGSRGPASSPAAAQPPAGPAGAPGSQPAEQPVHVMRAAVDREPDPAGPEPLDLAALRRELLTELRNQLRTDFERGG